MKLTKMQKSANRRLLPKEISMTLDEKLTEQGIKFHSLEPYRMGNMMFVDCPKYSEKVWIPYCKVCKNFLGSTTKTKRHWLCLKEK